MLQTFRFLRAASLGCLCGVLEVANAGPAPRFATDHVLVCLKPGVYAAASVRAGADPLSALAGRLGLPAGAELLEPPLLGLLRNPRRPAASMTREPLAATPFLYLRLPPGSSVGECLHGLEHHPLVDYAEPDYVGCTAVVPSDPNFADQWHHQNPLKPSASIQTPLAWDITQGSSNVIVAVLDTGLADGPEFAGRTVPGYNFVDTNDVTLDDNGHGTQVAGVLGANPDNGVLGAGVDWRCRIMPVKVFDHSNLGYHSWWAQGIDYAVGHGCKIINLSGASTEFGRTVQRAITNAIARGVIFVTAAGNLGATNLGFPGYLRECLTVGATDSQDSRALFSNSGPQLDLVAPGVDLPTVGLSGGLEFVRGTSFAAPLVAGVCALLAAVQPGITQTEAQWLLCAGAEDQVGGDTDPPGFDPQHGWGRLNAFHTLLLATIRIDQFGFTDGGMELSWTSPANARSRQPYRVEGTTVFGGKWTSLPGTFRYGVGRTQWIDGSSPVGAGDCCRYYRVVVRPL